MYKNDIPYIKTYIYSESFNETYLSLDYYPIELIEEIHSTCINILRRYLEKKYGL